MGGRLPFISVVLTCKAPSTSLLNSPLDERFSRRSQTSAEHSRLSAKQVSKNRLAMIGNSLSKRQGLGEDFLSAGQRMKIQRENKSDILQHVNLASEWSPLSKARWAARYVEMAFTGSPKRRYRVPKLESICPYSAGGSAPASSCARR